MKNIQRKIYLENIRWREQRILCATRKYNRYLNAINDSNLSQERKVKLREKAFTQLKEEIQYITLITKPPKEEEKRHPIFYQRRHERKKSKTRCVGTHYLFIKTNRSYSNV